LGTAEYLAIAAINRAICPSSYCTIALMLRALMFRRIRQAGLQLSLKRVLSELNAICEVVTIYPRKRRDRTARKQTTLTKTSELQQQLLLILGLKEEEYASYNMLSEKEIELWPFISRKLGLSSA